MIILKLAAVVIGVGAMLASMLPTFSGDVVLAAVICLS
jgi:hypothetical protein